MGHHLGSKTSLTRSLVYDDAIPCEWSQKEGGADADEEEKIRWLTGSQLLRRLTLQQLCNSATVVDDVVAQ